MIIQLYELDHVISDEEIKFTVTLARFEGKMILIRNRNRTVWELPGGKRESGESIEQAASRELYEETGAVDFKLNPLGFYALDGTFGMVFHAEVTGLGALPDHEVAEIKLVDELPSGLNYGEVYYRIFDRWGK